MLLFSLISFVAGLTVLISLFGFNKDISSYVYAKDALWYRVVYKMWFASFLLPLTEIDTHGAMFYSKIGIWVLLLVPVFAEYRPKKDGVAHVIGAVLGIALIHVGIAVDSILLWVAGKPNTGFLVVPVYALFYWLLTKSKLPKKTMHAELGAAITMFLGLLLTFYL